MGILNKNKKHKNYYKREEIEEFDFVFDNFQIKTTDENKIKISLDYEIPDSFGSYINISRKNFINLVKAIEEYQVKKKIYDDMNR